MNVIPDFALGDGSLPGWRCNRALANNYAASTDERQYVPAFRNNGIAEGFRIVFESTSDAGRSKLTKRRRRATAWVMGRPPHYPPESPNPGYRSSVVRGRSERSWPDRCGGPVFERHAATPQRPRPS